MDFYHAGAHQRLDRRLVLSDESFDDATCAESDFADAAHGRRSRTSIVNTAQHRLFRRWPAPTTGHAQRAALERPRGIRSNFDNDTRTLTWDTFADLIVGKLHATGEINTAGGWPAAAGRRLLELAFASQLTTTPPTPHRRRLYFDNVSRLLPRVVNSEWKRARPDSDNDAGNGNAATNLWLRPRRTGRSACRCSVIPPRWSARTAAALTTAPRPSTATIRSRFGAARLMNFRQSPPANTIGGSARSRWTVLDRVRRRST
jgi:hypothetical protein